MSCLKMDTAIWVQTWMRLYAFHIGANTLGKGMHPTILPPATNKQKEQMRLFNLGMAINQGEGKFWIKTYAGHCWRSRDELISNVLLWTPTYGRAKAGQTARTYIQQLCEDTGCSPEDLPEAMKDMEKWRQRVRDIRASGTTWWWWWWYSSKKINHVPHPACVEGL